MPSPPDPREPPKPSPPPLALELPDADFSPPSAPRPTAPFPPVRPAPSARPNPADDGQIARLLTTASIQMRRGQTADAEKAVQEILTRQPGDAAAHELLGDIRLARGDFDGAGAAFKQALEIEPRRATAEAKLARATLRQTETQRVKDMGIAYAGAETNLVGAGESGKNSRLPLVGSLLLPGLGQMVNGQFVKGGVIMAVYFLGLALLYPHAADLAHLFVPRTSHPASPLLWLSLALLLADWIYAVADAARSSR